MKKRDFLRLAIITISSLLFFYIYGAFQLSFSGVPITEASIVSKTYISQKQDMALSFISEDRAELISYSVKIICSYSIDETVISLDSLILDDDLSFKLNVLSIERMFSSTYNQFFYFYQ